VLITMTAFGVILAPGMFRLVRSQTVGVKNDLYVDAASRGEGVGRALIEAAAEVARERGSPILEWSTSGQGKHRETLASAARKTAAFIRRHSSDRPN